MADTFDCPILFNMAGRNFLYFFKEVNDRMSGMIKIKLAKNLRNFMDGSNKT